MKDATTRFVRIESEEDARLREVEQDPLLKQKVRLRAQVRRLSGRGESVGRIAAYTGRSEASVLRDLDRWERRGFEGLADGTAPGNAPRVRGEVKRRSWRRNEVGLPPPVERRESHPG